VPVSHPAAAAHLSGVEEHFRRCASATDAGDQSTREALRYLGDRGLIDLGVAGSGPGTLVDMVEVITTVARACMSSAFSTWAQRMTLEYVAVAEPGFAADGLVEGLATGRLAGSTAMASAFQDLAGLASLPVTFTREANGALRLDGAVRWASNLFADGFWVVLAARGSDGERVVVALPSSSPGLVVDPYPELLALGATASSSFRLEGVTVPPELVVTRDLPAFLAAVRRPFLCLQAAFCLGLAEASLASIDARPGAGYGQFDVARDELAARVADVGTRLHELAAAEGAVGAGEVAGLLRMRLDAARLAGDAVDLEIKVTGGAAYLARSATARRLREATFLPIQSPTEAHLLWELAACSS
jgi:alkylation response protein AidB-like acyl-CoA dehydrogenase